MVKRGTNKERYNFLIDRDIYRDFSLLCSELGLVRSKNLEISMQDFIHNNSKLLEKIKNRSDLRKEIIKSESQKIDALINELENSLLEKIDALNPLNAKNNLNLISDKLNELESNKNINSLIKEAKILVDSGKISEAMSLIKQIQLLHRNIKQDTGSNKISNDQIDNEKNVEQ